ncbi:MAG: class I SAM-dependent methyltransferase [Steroidobacteraceae bacterium]|nr:class I SAM-dependent methyltransferase [Steroidobacteraceae bacterium]MDW8260402.1 class I SAM-dependent methyltransferase [Gammaproteobacteria bacterium]
MNAVLERPAALEPLRVHESRDFRAYHDFLRAARNFVEHDLVGQLREQYDRAIAAAGVPAPADWRAAQALMAPLLPLQLYQFFYRHLQRFKYHRPTLGIFATLEAQRARLAAALERAAAQADPRELRLNPALELPEYFRAVHFHQHTGGVAHDILDGLAYEIGRRTTVPSHGDPNGIYRLLFDALPQRRYARVLDWGTGHGAALHLWQQLHPESECYGVDLSAPCLILAHQRARELGLRCFFSQQDLAHLDFPDAHFDLIFFNFMLHELPPTHLPALLREAARVLRPGGLFGGHEFHLRPGDPFQHVLQRSHAFLNNETYATPWYDAPIAQWAEAAGFSRVSIEPFEPLNRSVLRAGRAAANANHWNLYLFEK